MEKDKWEEIRFLLSESLQKKLSESSFEPVVIQMLRVLGWKNYQGDLQIRPSIPIGASNRLIPDFIINSSEQKNLFVIEIKQPNIPIIVSFQKQLFSYMRQLKLQYGVLIGDVIQLFYDGDLIDQDDPVLLETIDYRKDTLKGEVFVGLFSKDNFSFDALEEFTKSRVKKMRQRTDKKILQKKNVSIAYQTEVLALIKQGLLVEYDAELIDKVLDDISIDIYSKKTIDLEKGKSKNVLASDIRKNITNNNDDISLENKSTKDTTKYIINKNGAKLPKNRFVLEFVKLYISEHPADFNELKKVFKDELQGSIGVINRLDDVEIKYANKSDKRHFVENEEVLRSRDGVAFVVSTQWGKDNVGNIVDLARSKGFLIDEI